MIPKAFVTGSKKKTVLTPSPFGTRMCESRVRMGLTRKEAAKKLHISYQTLVSYESGRVTPTIRRFYKICEMYDVSSDWLLWGEQ